MFCSVNYTFENEIKCLIRCYGQLHWKTLLTLIVKQPQRQYRPQMALGAAAITRGSRPALILKPAQAM
ncbi:hypothetical protein XELAEV_18007927mg [Xenopus laevis]|uniref:Uncharacterized protein n=1 Tax=Xenopus laevis TaxID=8355 RepID=A0A974E2L6_XENLA|nr:hypothetical protein XELAEV_18007927mg [Xenopus laevis]